MKIVFVLFSLVVSSWSHLAEAQVLENSLFLQAPTNRIFAGTRCSSVGKRLPTEQELRDLMNLSPKNFLRNKQDHNRYWIAETQFGLNFVGFGSLAAPTLQPAPSALFIKNYEDKLGRSTYSIYKRELPYLDGSYGEKPLPIANVLCVPVHSGQSLQ